MENNKQLYEVFNFKVSKGQSLLRIDKYLYSKISHISRCKIQDGIRDNLVLVNNKPIKINYRVKPDDHIIIYSTEEPKDKTDLPEDLKLEIVYEDEYLLILNKKSGIVVHPTFNNYEHTIYNGLLYYFQNSNEYNKKFTPHMVHRIDKNTSGLLMIGKGNEYTKKLSELFVKHQVKRTYLALVWGNLKNKKGTIRTRLERSDKDKKLITVYFDRGKEAITHYEVIKEFENFSLVKCTLETGRMHQIRVHMQYLGHPLFYDYFYGGDTIEDKIIDKSVISKIKELFDLFPKYTLHSHTMIFIHPFTNKEIHLEIDLPNDFQNLLQLLT